jgi:putative flippase GtrA
VSKGKAAFFARYILVGLANTAIYSGLLWLFLRSDKFPYAVAIGFAFVLAMIFQYLANKYFTFGATSSSWPEVFRYLASAGLNYGVSVVVVWFSLELLGLTVLSASLISAATVALLGFLVSLFWVYRK